MILLALVAAARILTLDEALASAREHQPQLHQAHAASEAADARAGQALAPLLPQLNASAGYSRTTANRIERPGSTGTLGLCIPSAGVSCSPWKLYNSFSDQIGLTQLIFDFGAAPFRLSAARSNAQAAQNSERGTLLTVELTVRQVYYDARANFALVKVAEDSLKNLQRHLEQIQGFVGAGTRPEIDLVQARTDTANARVQLINAENAWETSRVQLNQAMGVPGSTDYELSGDPAPPVAGEDASGDVLLAEAEKARPEIAAAEEQVHAAQATLRSFQAQYLPSLSGNLGFVQGGTVLDNLGWNASAGVTLSWNLFAGGLTRQEAREAEANLAGMVAQLDLLRQQLRVDVDTARLAVRATKVATGAAQEALVNARERLRLAEQRYLVGVGSAIELGDAQVALTQAAAQAVQADDRLAVARAQLLRALGRRQEDK
jgi:outer membrane protein